MTVDVPPRPTFPVRAGMAIGWIVFAIVVGLVPMEVRAQVNAQEQSFFNLMKNSPAQRRAELVLDPVLCKVARARAKDLAVRGYFAHVNPDGVAANFLVRKAGYVLPASYSTARTANEIESLSAGQPSALATFGDLVADPPHRVQILGELGFYAAQTHVGIGFVDIPGSPFQYYWAIITAPPSGPMLSIASPANEGQVNEASVTVQGMTGGEPVAASVRLRVENDLGAGPWVTADGVAVWSATVGGLEPGPNTLRVQTLDGGGEMLREALREVRYVVLAPVTIDIAGSGTVMTGFAGTTQREVGRSYMVIATPALGSVFLGWTGDVTTDSRIVTFTVPAEGLALTANFIPNPFLMGKGGYGGLFVGSGARHGLLTLSLLPNGTFTGKLRLEGESVALKGRFSASGAAQITAKFRDASTATLALNFTPNDGPPTISATILAAEWRADVRLDAASKPTRTPNPNAGRYTVVLPPVESATPTPPGFGALSVRVDSLGAATISGALADGTPVLVTSRVTQRDTINVFLAPYAGKGLLTGALKFHVLSASDVDGTFHWHRLAGTAPFPDGFSLETSSVGHRYIAPAIGQPAVPITMNENNAALALGNGGIDDPVVQVTTLSAANKLTFPDPLLAGLSAKINAASGVVTGQFTHPTTNKRTPFRGVILQRFGAAFGFFSGGGQAGFATFAPAEMQANPVAE